MTDPLCGFLPEKADCDGNQSRVLHGGVPVAMPTFG